MHKFVNIVGAGVIALMIGYVGDVPNAVAAEDCYRVPGTDIIQKDDRLVANCFAAKGNSYMAELYRRSAEAKAKLNADITTSMAFYAKYCTGGTLHIGGSKADATRAWCAPSQINTIETASGTRGFPEGSNATMDWTDVGVFQKEVRERIRPGTEIIKPRSTSRIMRWQRTGQDEQIFYGIGKAGNEKYINLSELSLAYEELINSMN